jgi:peptidoglycan/xylan/chitin deacetylase (PgdA/CDA1 family)
MRAARFAYLALPLLALLLALEALFVGYLRGAWLVALLVLYVSVATIGVLLPWLGVHGSVISHGSRGHGRVALTFDDGPHPETTRQVLAMLARHQAHATFFVIGEKAERNPEVIRAIDEAGHELGVHGHRHDRLYSLRRASVIEADMAQGREAVARITGTVPSYCRPPVGYASGSTLRGCRRAGLEPVFWSVRALDGLRRARPEAVFRRVLQRLEDGAIILLHDAAERDDHLPASLAVLDRILEELGRRGFSAVRLSELLDPPAVVDVPGSGSN